MKKTAGREVPLSEQKSYAEPLPKRQRQERKLSKYAEQLRDPRWQKRRLEILERDEFTCVMCGDKDSTLVVHHLYYEYGMAPWEYEAQFLVTLCQKCHTDHIPMLARNTARMIASAMRALGRDTINILNDIRPIFSAFKERYGEHAYINMVTSMMVLDDQDGINAVQSIFAYGAFNGTEEDES